jgi:magnesium transporter
VGGDRVGAHDDRRIYGMNFEHMPELGSVYGYPAALTVIVVACTALYRNFKRRDWL